MSEPEYQYREQISPAEFIKDYLEFGVYNGTIGIKAYLVYWDMLPGKSKNIRMAKILAEYGRAVEELFAFLYVLAEQAGTEEDVFFERLIYYDSRCLNVFIDSTDFSKLCQILHLADPGVAAGRLGLSTEKMETLINETITLIYDLRDERKKVLQGIYNKLKHPFLVYSRVPTIINAGVGFGIMQKPDLKGHPDVDCVPIIVSKKQALVHLQNVRMICGTLIFLLRYFLVSYELRAKQ